MQHKFKSSSNIILRFVPHILEFPGSTCIRHAPVRVARPWRQTWEPPDGDLVAILGQEPVQGARLGHGVSPGGVQLGDYPILPHHNDLHLNILLVFGNMSISSISI